MSDKKRVSLNKRVLQLVKENGDDFYLVGSRCDRCCSVYFPQRLICPNCLADDTIKPISLSKSGKLYSFTIIRRQSLCPPGFTAPYSFGYVDLSEGVRVISLLEGDLDSLVINMKVELTLHRVGEDESGNEIVWYSFVPEQTHKTAATKK